MGGVHADCVIVDFALKILREIFLVENLCGCLDGVVGVIVGFSDGERRLMSSDGLRLIVVIAFVFFAFICLVCGISLTIEAMIWRRFSDLWRANFRGAAAYVTWAMMGGLLAIWFSRLLAHPR